jgi:hypothetical protein
VGIDSAYRCARGCKKVAEGAISRALEQDVATGGFTPEKVARLLNAFTDALPQPSAVMPSSA